jgi:hypothetical protein
LVAVVTCLLVATLTIVAAAEDYLVIPESRLFIRAIPNRADTPENLVTILEPGDRAVVVACVNYKSDIALKVKMSNGQIGYVSNGGFHLERGQSTVGFFISDPERIVWSCRGFYDHLKRPAS